MSFELRQLRALVAVVDTGSVGRAAQALNLTQPALSRMIRRLELDVGEPLFERRTTGMVMTSYGELLLRHARLLVAEAAAAREELREMRGLGRGVARVGALSSVAQTILPPAVKRLLQRRPGLKVMIVEDVAEDLLSSLLNREIDLVVAAELPFSEDVIALPSPVEELAPIVAVVASADHPLTQQAKVAITSLDAFRWILTPNTLQRRIFEKLLIDNGLSSPDVAVETPSLTAIKALLIGSPYLGWLPQPIYAAEESIGLLKTISIPALTLQRQLYIYRRRKGSLPAAAQALVEEMRVTG